MNQTSSVFLWTPVRRAAVDSNLSSIVRVVRIHHLFRNRMHSSRACKRKRCRDQSSSTQDVEAVRIPLLALSGSDEKGFPCTPDARARESVTDDGRGSREQFAPVPDFLPCPERCQPRAADAGIVGREGKPRCAGGRRDKAIGRILIKRSR